MKKRTEMHVIFFAALLVSSTSASLSGLPGLSGLSGVARSSPIIDHFQSVQNPSSVMKPSEIRPANSTSSVNDSNSSDEIRFAGTLLKEEPRIGANIDVVQIDRIIEGVRRFLARFALHHG
jgi:hypothetical protein